MVSGPGRFHSPTFPDDPHVEVEQTRRVCQAGYNLPLHWNRVLIDLLVKALAQCNDVVGLLMRWRFLLVSAVEPKPHPIKKMEPLAVEDFSAHSFFIGTEEHAGSKDALESLDEAAVVNAVFWKLQELKQLSGSLEVNGTALLLYCQRRDPDRN